LTISQLTPQYIKAALTTHLNDLLAPIQAEFQASEEFQEVHRQAYPVVEAKKVVKVKKDKGDPAKRAAAAEKKKLADAAAKETADGVAKLSVESSAEK